MTTTSNAVSHAVDRAGHARAAALDLATQVLKLVNTVRATELRSFDGVLSRIGLERRHGPLRRAAWFAAGAATVGIGVFLTTTETGKAIRQRVGRFVAEEIDTVAARATSLGSRVGAAFHQDGAGDVH